MTFSEPTHCFLMVQKRTATKKQQKTILLSHFSNNCYQTNLIIVSQLEFNVSTTSTHTCSESFCKVLMCLLMCSRVKSSHFNFNATFNSLIVFGYGRRLWYFSSVAPLKCYDRSQFLTKRKRYNRFPKSSFSLCSRCQ